MARPNTLPSGPLKDRSILITGGSGSFGHAFVRRALADGARKVVVFSRDELKQSQMAQEFPDDRLRWFIGDVRSPERLTLAMKGIDLVVHAAAMKRIESCEADPSEAVETNVIGTRNVALAAIASGVERAIFLSTDKAPLAHTLYGMTKATAERVWCAANVYAAGTPTRLSGTRYGNVLASRGSVLGVWRQQAEQGVPLRITDPRATRFWMRLDHAVDLVLLAFREMRGGEIFVPKVGSAPIANLAAAILPDGFDDGAYSYHVTGMGAGERQHETLISSDEARTTYDCGSHYVIEPEARLWEENIAPLPFPLVGPRFEYRSDTNPNQLSVKQLRELAA